MAETNITGGDPGAPAKPQLHPAASGHQDILYPFDTAPERGTGAAVEIEPGILWLRMPMGEKSASAVNVWALADADGWSLVDTGIQSPQTLAGWQNAFTAVLGGRPIHRILATHLHPDHCGMAGWIVEQTGAAFCMTRTEYLMLRVLINDLGRAAPPVASAFYHAAGWEKAEVERYRVRFGDFGKMVYQAPDCFQRMADGDTIVIGEDRWRVVVGAGHSPEHVCLYSHARGIFISGDQVLPRISSNISVHALEPEADPLSDWIAALRAIRARVPNSVLVLPGHGEPFRGLHARIDTLLDRHENALALLHQALAEPKRAVDVFDVLFRRPITAAVYGMATGESLAHLACLRTRGLATRMMDEARVAWWRAA